MSQKNIAEQIADELAPYLGPFNAKVAVKTFAKKILGLNPEQLTADHVPALIDSLERLLRTFVGRKSAEALLAEIQRRIC